MQKCANPVEFAKCCGMNIYSQKSASIQSATLQPSKILQNIIFEKCNVNQLQSKPRRGSCANSFSVSSPASDATSCSNSARMRRQPAVQQSDPRSHVKVSFEMPEYTGEAPPVVHFSHLHQGLRGCQRSERFHQYHTSCVD